MSNGGEKSNGGEESNGGENPSCEGKKEKLRHSHKKSHHLLRHIIIRIRAWIVRMHRRWM